MWNHSVLLVLMVACASTPTSNNPYAAYGCAETPVTTKDNPRVLYDVELGRIYTLQGGAYHLRFDIAAPTNIRVRLTGIEGYDSLFVLVGDQVDSRRAGSLFHDAGAASNEDGMPLTEATVTSKEPLEVNVGISINRYLSEYTLRNDDGKRLFCQTYQLVVEAVP